MLLLSAVCARSDIVGRVRSGWASSGNDPDALRVGVALSTGNIPGEEAAMKLPGSCEEAGRKKPWEAAIKLS